MIVKQNRHLRAVVHHLRQYNNKNERFMMTNLSQSSVNN